MAAYSVAIGRCPNCSHPLSEHENGRCTYYMVSDHGYWSDPICSCLLEPSVAEVYGAATDQRELDGWQKEKA